MTTPNCPDRRLLAEFTAGKLDEPSADQISVHLEHCVDCQSTIVNLAEDQDTVGTALRKVAQSPVKPAGDAVRKALHSAAQMIPPPPSAKVGASVAASGVPTVTLSLEQFAHSLSETGVVDNDELTAARGRLSAEQREDPQALARELIAAGRLTKFQALNALQGKAKGLVFGEHVVLDRIGAGGMGQVFKAKHRRMDRLVALKVMSSAAMKNADSVRRFEREVRAAAKLMHPNIVTAFDAGQQDGTHFLVMEFVDGPDLSSLLKKQGKLPIKQACDYIAQAARGFAFAHSQGIVHRDIKPGNLLVDKNGTVKVLDMGLARFDDGGVGGVMTEGELTQSGAVMGTVDYMAPEQAMNTRNADAKSDVYGLGCSLYRLLTGESVYGGQTMVEKIMAHREKPIPVLHQVRPDAPPALEALVARMLAKEPSQRPSMQEVAEKLTNLDALPAIATAVPVAPSIAAATATGRPAQAVAPIVGTKPKAQGAAPPRKRSNTPLLAAAGAGAVLIALGVWFIFRDKDGNETARVQMPDGGKVETAVDPGPQKLAPPVATASPSTSSVASSDPSKVFALPQSTGTAASPTAPTTQPIQVAIAGSGWYGPPPLSAEQESQLQPGLLRTLYPRHARQVSDDGAFVDPAEFGAPLPQVSTGAVVTGLNNWTFPKDLNATATGYLKIDSPGEYAFMATGFYDRTALYLDGKPVCRYQDGTPTIATVQLRAGYVPIMSVGYFAALGKATATWRVPGEDTFSTIPESALFHLPGVSAPTATPPAPTPPIVTVASLPSAGDLWLYADRFDGNSPILSVDSIRFDGTSPLTIECWAMPVMTPALQGFFKNTAESLHTIFAWDRELGSRPQFGMNWLSDGVDPTNDQWINSRQRWSGGKVGGMTSRSLGQVLRDQPVHLAITVGPKVDKLQTLKVWVDGKSTSGFESEYEYFPDGKLLSRGSFDELRVSKGVRYTANFTPQRHFEPDADTIALYHCDEGSGMQLVDASGNGHHGVLTNAKWSPVGSPAGTPVVAVANNPPVVAPSLPAAILPNTGGPSPTLDALKRENLLPTLLSTVGFTDPAQVPAELVYAFRGRQDVPGQALDQPISSGVSPDFRTFALITKGGEMRIYDALTGAFRNQDKFGSLVTMAFSHDGKKVAAGGGSGTYGMWDCATGQRQYTLPTNHEAFCASAFGPDDRRITMAIGKGRVFLYDVADGNTLWVKRDNTAYVGAMTFSPDGRTIVTGARDKTMRFWDVATGEQLGDVLAGLTGNVEAVAFSPDGRTLATGGSDSAVRLWDVAARRETAAFAQLPAPVNSVAYDPSGRFLAVGTDKGTAHLLDVNGLKELRFWKFSSDPLHVRFNPTGRYLAVSSNNAMLWILRLAEATPTIAGGSSSTAVPAATPPSAPAMPVGAMDLLSLVQLPRDAVAGNWSRNDATLSLRLGKGTMPRVQIPYTPGGDEYDLILTARKNDAHRAVGVILGMVAQGRQIYVRVNGRSCGINDGDTTKAPNYVEYPELPIHNRQSFTILCALRKNSVRVDFNGKPLYEFRGDFSQLVGPTVTIPRLDQLFLAVDANVPFDFTSLQFVPVGEKTANLQPTTQAGVTASVANSSRQPVPEAKDQAATLALIKDVYKDDYLAARVPDKKSPFADKLLQQSRTVVDPIERFVLLNEARTLAADGDDPQVLKQVLAALVENFDVDPAQSLVDGWKAMLAKSRPATTVRAIYDDAAQRFDAAVIAADFDAAKKYAEFANTTAPRLTDAAISKSARERLPALTARQTEYAAAKAAVEKLTTAPDDAEANAVVGRYRALVEGDWPNALPLLAKGNEEPWKDLATKSLAAAADAPSRAAIGDAWWDAAQTKPTLKPDLTAAALYWYQAAVGSLTGLNKTRVEKRIADAAAIVRPRTLPPTMLTGEVATLRTGDTSLKGEVPKVFDFGGPAAAPAPVNPPPPAATQNATLADPAFQQWVQQTAALPADQQVAAVKQKLIELNPGFDGVLKPAINNGIVTELTFSTSKVTNISPVRAFSGLKVLLCDGKEEASTFSDLSPLQGMPLTTLSCGKSSVSDLSPLRGMPLNVLVFYSSQVSDLSPLRGMPLTEVRCGSTPVSDLSPLHECKNLSLLAIRYTKVSRAATDALKQVLPNCKIQ